jgi:ubiquinone biosynthesis protein COQ9
MDMVRMKDAVVEAMLPHAAFDGWSTTALRAVARDLDLDGDLLSPLFPRGSVDVISHFVDYADRAMATDFAEGGFADAGIGVQVFQAVRLRLERWSAHREAIRRAASILSLPQNLPLALRLTWGTADAVWLTVGDRSHDFSWYTKRATLSAIYSATLLYWLDDASEDSADSWAFLRRRLDDLRHIPKLRQRVEDMVAGSKMGGMAARFKVPLRG